MKKRMLLLAGVFVSPVYAASIDCETAAPMVAPTVHLAVQALRMHRENADYQTIAQWRVNTFNSEIDKIIDTNQLPPKVFMDPDMEVTRTVYNDLMMDSKIFVNEIYSYARNGGKNKDMVELHRERLNEAVKKFRVTCVSEQ